MLCLFCYASMQANEDAFILFVHMPDVPHLDPINPYGTRPNREVVADVTQDAEVYVVQAKQLTWTPSKCFTCVQVLLLGCFCCFTTPYAP